MVEVEEIWILKKTSGQKGKLEFAFVSFILWCQPRRPRNGFNDGIFLAGVRARVIGISRPVVLFPKYKKNMSRIINYANWMISYTISCLKEYFQLHMQFIFWKY